VAIAYFIWKTCALSSFFRKVLDSRLKKLLFYTLGIAALSSIIFALYHYKKDSADGRILIWKVGFEMIQDKPILGHGINSFQSNYMHYQADYFEQHPTHELRYLAGNNAYAFNEVLRLIAEQGLFGLGIILMVLYIFYRSTKKSNKSLPKSYMEFVSQSGLILIIIFGLFSYPLEILELKLMAVLFLAVLSTSSNKTIFLRPLNFLTTIIGKWTSLKTLKRALILGSISFGIFFGWDKVHNTIEVYKSFNYAISEFKKGDFNGFIHFGKSNYTTLKSNGYFLGYYGKSLFANQQYTEALAIFEPTLFLIPSAKVCIDIGKCYERLEKFKKAELFYTRASNMVPAQFKPQYLIAKMYFENGQVEKAKRIATELLASQKVKVYSIEVHIILEALKEMAK